jgi:hypothetical protein
MSGEVTQAAAATAQHPDQPNAEELASFNVGFKMTDEPAATQTPQPEKTVEPASKEPENKEDPPEYVQITRKDWDDLIAKAGAIDEVRSDSKRQIDSIAGNVGGLKQQVERLQQRGGTKVTAESLKRLGAEYPALAEALAEDISEILSAPAGTTLDPADVERRARELIAPTVNKLEKNILRLRHPDWEQALASDEFKAYQRTLPPEENARLMESTDGEYVGEHITTFKQRKAQAEKQRETSKPVASPAPTAAPRSSARQERLEAAAPAKGQGSGAEAPNPVDDFNSGYGLKGRA